MRKNVVARNMTVTLGTETCEGFIKHKRHRLGNITIEAPVKLVRGEKGLALRGSTFSTHELLPIPVKAYPTGYVYAMPGGYSLGIAK